MSQGFSVQPAALRDIATALDNAGVAVADALAAFNAGPAVGSIGTRIMPDPASQEKYEDAVKGTQNLTKQWVDSLGTWAESFRGSAAFYEGADQASVTDGGLV